jgi:hypothetical protein
MTSRLAVFWYELETSFPLGGARRRLRALVGDDLVGELERAGILAHRRVATSYPCDRWAGDGCPRVVRQSAEGRTLALCGNPTRQCATVELSANDVDFLAMSPEGLAAAVAKALQIRSRFEPLSGIRDGFRIGYFVPEPEVKHAVYFLSRCGERDYSEGLDALRTHARGQTVAVLLPTDRFISENLRRQTTAVGIPLLALADSVGLSSDGSLRALVPPLQLFAGVGADEGTQSAATAHVAHALMRERGGAPTWRTLDEAGYHRLIGDPSAYDIVADELTKTVLKPKIGKRTAHVPSWHFKAVRAALERRSYFDPGTGDDDGIAAKQMFQRARRIFDIKIDDRWAIFPTERTDHHAVYRFDPKSSVTFAFVFAAHGANRMPRFTAENEVTPVESLRTTRGASGGGPRVRG